MVKVYYHFPCCYCSLGKIAARSDIVHLEYCWVLDATAQKEYTQKYFWQSSKNATFPFRRIYLVLRKIQVVSIDR